MNRTIAAMATAIILGGCQSNYAYQQFLPNAENFDVAKAKCEMMSSSTQQGMVAWGSPSYVAGAQLGNSLGNAVRADQFVQQCMTIQGWKRVNIPEPSSSQPKAATQSNRNPANIAKDNTIDMMAMRYLAENCHLPIKPDKQLMLKTIAAQEPNLAKQGRVKGQEVMNNGVKGVGRAKTCEAIALEVRGLDWL